MQKEVNSAHAPGTSQNVANAEVNRTHVIRPGDADVKVHPEGGAVAAVAHHVTGRERGIDRAAAERAKLQNAGQDPADRDIAAGPAFSQVPTRQSDFRTRNPQALERINQNLLKLAAPAKKLPGNVISVTPVNIDNLEIGEHTKV